MDKIKEARVALLAQAEKSRQEREERERQTREREATDLRDAAALTEMHAVAGRCGYEVTFRGDDGQSVFITGENESFAFDRRYTTTLYTPDIKIALLIKRACREVETSTGRTASPACKEASTFLTSRMSQPDFPDRFKYMLGKRERRSACENNLYDRGDEISDAASFDRVMAAYQKQFLKERREHEKTLNRTPPPGNTTPPEGGRSREPGSSGKAYIWDPGCSCWVREQ